MKIEIYIEDGAPLLVFPQQINRNKTVNCYSQRAGHVQVTRAHLRTLAMPDSGPETIEAWRVLAYYARLVS